MRRRRGYVHVGGVGGSSVAIAAPFMCYDTSASTVGKTNRCMAVVAFARICISVAAVITIATTAIIAIFIVSMYTCASTCARKYIYQYASTCAHTHIHTASASPNTNTSTSVSNVFALAPIPAQRLIEIVLGNLNHLERIKFLAGVFHNPHLHRG